MYIPYTCSFIDLYKYMQCKEHSRTFDIPTQPTRFWDTKLSSSFFDPLKYHQS